MGEGHVVRWDQNITFWYKLHSTCLDEEEGWVQSKEHHPNCEAWGWKHNALGVLFCKGDRKTAPYWGEDGWGHVSQDFGQQPPSLSKSTEHWVVAGSSSMAMTPNTQQGQLRSGSVRSISKFWSGLASLQAWTQLKIYGGSWNSVLRSDSPKSWKIWRRPEWRSGPKSLLQCVQTWSRTTGNVWPL